MRVATVINRLVLTGILAGVVFGITLTGCSSNPETRPAQTNVPAETTAAEQKKEFPGDAEIIADISNSSSSSAQYNEDIQELKHWKYWAQPNVSGSQPGSGVSSHTGSQSGNSSQPRPYSSYSTAYDDRVISYQFLSEEELDRFVSRLIAEGYLSGKPADKSEFANALRDFQRDQGLPATGELDAATIKALLEDRDL